MKVFHAARQDIEIVWNLAKKIPHPIFDTQVAAMVLGYGDSISYDQLVQRITGDTLDKSNRFTDWTRRPLTEAQLRYAVSDVTHLRDVYLKLSSDLDDAGTQRLGARRNGSAHRSRYLQDGAGTRLGTPEKPCPQAEGSRHTHRGRGMAGARGADPRRSARTRAQGRRDRRHRDTGPDHASSNSGSCVHCRRVSSARNGARRSSRRSNAASHAIRSNCRASSASRARPTAPPRSSYSRCCCA